MTADVPKIQISLDAPENQASGEEKVLDPDGSPAGRSHGNDPTTPDTDPAADPQRATPSGRADDATPDESNALLSPDGDASGHSSDLEDGVRGNGGLPTPPDGGWGWVVVIASFFVHVIADGVAYSFGVYLEDFTEYFDTGHGSTSLLSSLMIGVTWGSGPIVSALTNMFGCRAVTMAGSIVASFGFIISIFAPNIIFMYFSFGVVSGIGLGLIFVPAIVSVTFYFEKRRAFATGLAVCGSGVGTFVFGPLTELLLQYYGSWKAAVLIEAAILLNCILCGALFLPLEAPKRKPVAKAPKSEVDTKESEPLTSKEANGGQPVIFPYPTNIKRTPSTSSLPHKQSSVDNKLSLGVQHNAQDFCSDFWINKKTHLNVTTNVSPKATRKSPSHLSPLARKDIFYSGSLRNIPLYTTDHEEYTRSMVSIPDVPRDVDETDSVFDSQTFWQDFRDKICCKTMSWKEILDFSILKDSVFIVFVISNVLTSLGFCVPYIFLPDRAKLLGCSRKQGAFLISIIGISNTLGRVVFGWIADRPGVNRLMMYSTVLVLCGISTIGSSLCTTYALLCLYAALFGCFLGVYVSITSVVLVDLLGLDKLTSAFGLLLLFQGIAAVLGPPIAGVVYDATGDYDISFYLMGTLITISGLMLYPIPFMQKRQKRKDPILEEHDIQLGKHASDTHTKTVVIADINI